MCGRISTVDSERLAFAEKCGGYWNGIGDRLRTLCLGSLVLVWGVFSQKQGETSLEVSLPQKEVLLGVAAFAVLVIGLDFAEYLLGVQYRRILAGYKVTFPRFLYERWEERTRQAKIILGLATLTVLCAGISWILWTNLGGPIVHAQNGDDSVFLGDWRGGNFSNAEYIDLSINAPDDASVRYKGSDSRRPSRNKSPDVVSTYTYVYLRNSLTQAAGMNLTCAAVPLSIPSLTILNC